MNENEPVRQLRAALDLRRDCNDLTKSVIALHQNGTPKLRIYELLRVLRKECADARDEPREDAILETMDYVSHEMSEISQPHQHG
jgi:hypothetical protein